MTVLVTGAAGLLGDHLVRHISSSGMDVIAVARSPQPVHFQNNSKVQWIQKDINSDSFGAADFASVETVFHLAAIKEIKAGQDERAFIKENEEATLKIIHSSKNLVKKIIFASSQMVYGDPNHLAVDEHFPLLGMESSPYACSKLNAENWLRCLQEVHGGKVVCLRFCGFIEGGGNIDYIIAQALKNSSIELYSKGSICRDYLSVQDASEAFMNAYNSKSKSGFDIFNIGSGKCINTLALTQHICQVLSSKSEIKLSDSPAPRKNFVFNIEKATQALGFKPNDLLESISAYAKNVKEKKSHA